jgi:hypothetical protein
MVFRLLSAPDFPQKAINLVNLVNPVPQNIRWDMSFRGDMSRRAEEGRKLLMWWRDACGYGQKGDADYLGMHYSSINRLMKGIIFKNVKKQDPHPRRAIGNQNAFLA